MPEDLWKIRERKGMTVSQLAARSGLPAQKIADYEAGTPVSATDRARLARALYIGELDINPQSQPRPAKSDTGKTAPGKKAPPSAGPPKQPPPPKPPAPARPGQIKHLLQLGQRLQIAPEQVEVEIGRPLAELTFQEARQWLKQYEERAQVTAEHPPGYRSKRAQLPEAVDEFEMQYLTQAQADEATLTVKMFNGETFSGQLIGFGTYALTLRPADGNEVTLQKLAIAYYRREGGDAA